MPQYISPGVRIILRMAYDESRYIDRFQSMRESNSIPIVDQAWLTRAQEKATLCRMSGTTSHKVFEYQDLRWLCHEDGSIQSIMWQKRPDYPVFEYVRGMLCGLLFHPAPQRLLNLGLGSGTLERYLIRNLPGASLTSVEPDPEIQQLARSWFDLPTEHPVVMQSAQDYLINAQATYDVIFCDIHPRSEEKNPLNQDAFLAELARALRPHGVVAINLLPEDEQDIVGLLLRIRRHLPCIVLFDVPRQQNLVVYGGTMTLPDRDTLEARIHASTRHEALAGQQLLRDFIWLPEVRPSSPL
jgi:spermidine synthase